MTDAAGSSGRLGAARMTPAIFMSRFGFYLALAILVVAFSLLSPAFLTTTNLINILQQTSTIGIIALGLTLVILCGGIDVSVGSVLGLGGMVAALAIRDLGASPAAAILLGTLSGFVVGIVNGLIVTRLRIDAFITTLATLSVVRGIVYIISNQYNVNVPDDSAFLTLGRGRFAGLPISVWAFLILLAVLWFLERRTTLGRSIHAIGSNEAAARLSAIPVSSVRTMTFAISGACAAFSGVIITSQVALAVPYQGTGYELDVIAAAVVGGVALSGGVGSVLVGALGSIFIGVLLNGMALINVPAIWQMVIQGVVIIAAVALYGVARTRTS